MKKRITSPHSAKDQKRRHKGVKILDIRVLPRYGDWDRVKNVLRSVSSSARCHKMVDVCDVKYKWN